MNLNIIPRKSQRLPYTTRPDVRVNLAELRPNRDAGISLQGLNEELPQLKGWNSGEVHVNDRVETYFSDK